LLESPEPAGYRQGREQTGPCFHVGNRARSRIIFVGHKRVPEYYLPVIADAGLTYIDLNPELARLKESRVDPCHWPVTHTDGHWNHEGHRFIRGYPAERLSEIERHEAVRWAPRSGRAPGRVF
jgi:hypothetical protein